MGSRGGPLWQRLSVSTPAQGSSHTAPAQGSSQAAPEQQPHSTSTPVVHVEHADGTCRTKPLPAAAAAGPTAHHPFWPWLDAWLQGRRLQASTQLRKLPFDFWGGLVGFLGYGLKDACPQPGEVPDAGLLFVDR